VLAKPNPSTLLTKGLKLQLAWVVTVPAGEEGVAASPQARAQSAQGALGGLLACQMQVVLQMPPLATFLPCMEKELRGAR